MKPIRVARVITRLNVGGPAIQAMLLTSSLDPDRFSSILLAGRPGPYEGDMALLRPIAGVKPILLEDLRREISPIHDARGLIALIRCFRTYRPHVVHTHLAKAGLLGRTAARLSGVPVIVHTFHGNVLSGYFGATASGLFTALERGLAKISTRIVAISPAQADELRRRGIGSPSKTVVIPLGFDLSPFTAARAGRFRKELGVGSAPLVAIVARLVQIKRIDLFLAAAAAVVERRPDARFVIVGDGPLRGELERLCAALDLTARVRFEGWRADVSAIYADLDVLVCSSDNEGTPVSVIEAMATGAAVVATAVGGVPDVIREGEGILVPRGDAGLLADAIVRLIDDPALRSRIGERARQRVHPEYDTPTLGRRVEQLYVELLDRAGIDPSNR